MRYRFRTAALMGFGVAVLLAGGSGAAPAPPSGHCHAVDGSFSTCPDGSAEWSDVPAHWFEETNAYLYAEQADLTDAEGPLSSADTFELMYDECDVTEPLGKNEYFLVTFDTVEEEDGEEEFERYAVHVFSDGTIIFLDNGEAVPDESDHIRAEEIEGQRGDAGFGPSPTCAHDHLIVEFEIALTATEIDLDGGYSPDPIFWGATPPKRPPIANEDEEKLEDDDEEVTVNVAANDTDPDGSIVPSTVAIASPPEHGTATPNGDGTVTFTKNDSFKHLDSFTYTINDDDGLTSNAATVSIIKPCSDEVGESIDDKSSNAAKGKEPKKGTDVDKDGLKTEAEDSAGTDPCHHDTDGDGLLDPWEVSGVDGAGFDLNADGSADVTRDQVFAGMGSPNPLRKDVFVEMDAYDCARGGCPPGDPMVHEILPEAMSGLQTMFNSLPARNANDGAPGVTLHLVEDEHIRHAPNCDLPPVVRTAFGRADQRGNASVIAAKALAVRYLVAGHSTAFDDSSPCPPPGPLEIGLNMIGWSALPAYDNTPFGRAAVGGRDIALSLGPVWICPQDKVVDIRIVKLFMPWWIRPLVPDFVTACDRESIRDPGIFPAKLPVGGGERTVPKPYCRPLGALGPSSVASERQGTIQCQSRAIAHLLGHALGLAGDGEVANNPVQTGAASPDSYPGAGSLQYAKSLYSLSESGDHLRATAITGFGLASPENTIFDNPIDELLATDTDGDGVIERDDNCSGANNPGQEDLDFDGVGDPCDRDIDSDAIENSADPLPRDTDNDGIDNPLDADDDGDTVADGADNCELYPNADQRDTDGDGDGDACDEDTDGDDVADPIEQGAGSNLLNAASKPEFVRWMTSCSDGVDNDRDGRTDGADEGCVDSDADGLPNHLDKCPSTADPGWGNMDGDAQSDACDGDIDNDGILNTTETARGSDPYESGSRPENLAAAGTCTDGLDNDADKLTDAEDLGCQLDLPGLVSNGTVQLGINREGHLNIPGGPPSLSGTTFVGLRYIPTRAESTAPGCLCEGWGVADASTGAAGFANVAVDGVRNLVVEDFDRTVDSAVSVVRAANTFRVTHDYHPSLSPNLFEVTVTIENISGHDTDVRYRRVMDWDIEPTAFSEFVTIVTIEGTRLARNVLFSSDNGFATANPLIPGGRILFTGDAVDSGPTDHGALFDFGFGTLAPGESVTFNSYYGAAGTEEAAKVALGTVGAEVYSFGQPNTSGGKVDGTPNTFIFAFTGVGGEPVVPSDVDADTVLDELDNCPRLANTDQADENLDGIGDVCSTAELEHTTAGFLQASLDGTTPVEPRPLRLGEEPLLLERLVRIVEFRVEAGLTDDVAELTENLVHSAAEAGLVDEDDADELIDDVLAQLDAVPPLVTVTFPAPDGQNGWFASSPVTGTVTAEDVSDIAGIACAGATVGTVTGLGTESASAPLTVTGDGTHQVSCTATDGRGNSGTAPDSVASVAIKIDATPPVVACSAEPGSLWPPNHRLVDVTTTVSVDGGVSGSAGSVLTAATSSEPDDGLGDGDTVDDLQGWAIGTPDTHGQVRAERSGLGPGRTYTLTYAGTDGAGNDATCNALVTVPHDQGALAAR